MIGPGWFDRADALRRLADDHHDVLVVGGGITGAGCALDAASRGLRTAMVEREDFASGTSSKSSKLVHGGLRYLQQGELGLVYDALHERQRLLRNAPHLVKVLPFLIPMFTGRDGILNPKLARALGSAMWMYDLTGGARIGKLHDRLSADEALARMPTLPRERLHSAYLYYDAQADDARLTLALARTAAVDHGAVVANRVRLAEVRKDAEGRVRGARLAADGQDIEVSCSAIVNATGVWADQVRALDEGADPRSTRPAKGVHITVPWGLVRNEIAAVVPVRRDRRSVFVVPWTDPTAGPGSEPAFTYVGTTDTDYDGPLDDPRCTPEDIDYLLAALNAAITTPVRVEDITGAWAGLRPLVRSGTTGRTADLSRRHRVAASPSGVVTVTGGKLTTYREMSADAVDAVVRWLGDRLDPRRSRSRTAKLALRGADGYEAVRDLGGERAALARHLADRHGGEARVLLAMVEADSSLGLPLVAGLPYVRAEAVYAARYEMARSVDDVLSRRTRARILARDASVAAADDVARLIGPVLGWAEQEQVHQADAYRHVVEAERLTGATGAQDDEVVAGSGST